MKSYRFGFYFFLMLSVPAAFLFTGCKKTETEQQCNNGLSLQEDRAIIDTWLNDHQQRDVFTFDDQALVYYFIEDPGTGTSNPTVDSLVSFHYEGRLLNGTLIDSATVAEPPVQPLRNFGNLVYVPYALSKLTKGGKLKLIIPSSSAFGCMELIGINAIPANSQLIYEYELTDIRRSY